MRKRGASELLKGENLKREEETSKLRVRNDIIIEFKNCTIVAKSLNGFEILMENPFTETKHQTFSKKYDKLITELEQLIPQMEET